MHPDRKDKIREGIRKANHDCPKCGAYYGLDIVDAERVGGLPGIKYKHCNNCGHSQAITKKPPRPKL